MTQSNIYFDYNATTPLDSTVLEKAPYWLSLSGNPSSIHQHGRGPKKLLRESRRLLAERLKCHPLELVFTSGGSESNNLAIKGSLLEIQKKNPKRNKVIIGGIEHPSVAKQVPQLKEMGLQVVKIPVEPTGQYNLNFYKSQLDESVALVSVMLANNEIGVIAPLREMVVLAQEVGALFHSDLVQCLGKYPFDLKTLDLDLASFSSHKVYAMKGAGMLYIKKGTPFQPLTVGGSQERGRRAGTENLAAIASLAHMVDQINPHDFVEKVTPLRDLFEKEIQSQVSGVTILGSATPRLCNTSCLRFDGMNGETLLMNLDIRGFSVGTGAACSSGNPEPSPVLLALGLSREEAQSSLRISLGKDTTREQVLSLVQNLKEVIEHLRTLEERMVENA
jgi:cysteine desulfurase